MNLESQEKVAIKIINKNKFKKHTVHILTKEVEFLSSLKHHCIVKFKEHRESTNRVYIITELVEGITLTKLMRSKEVLSNRSIVNIIKEILEGLNYIHSLNIIHRDIKPGLILIIIY